MQIMLEPAEVTACEISLELYADIFCGRYDCLEWHTYQSCNSDYYTPCVPPFHNIKPLVRTMETT